MHNFQKPENALKRAAELRAIGQSEEALTVLHSAIGHRFFRTQGWDMVQEQIMLEYVGLCIEQDRLRLARDGLHQYRLISQHANVASLGKVVLELLERAEARLNRTLSGQASGGVFPGDSGELLWPGLEVGPEGRGVEEALRFVWEIYKMILDIMRATPKLERVYHETARRAVAFCRAHWRQAEFKRLSDVLRGHHAFLLKVQSKPEMECMLRPELHIETRISQLIAACELGMWKEAFNTVEDLYALGIRDFVARAFQGSAALLGPQRERLLRWLAVFYERLALIFWVSDLLLFHALATLRYTMHVRMWKKRVEPGEVTRLCSRTVLAALAIPTHAPQPSTAVYEMEKRMATLLGYNTIPTRESLHSSMSLKSLLPLASEEVQKLYELVENEPSMKLCHLTFSLLTPHSTSNSTHPVPSSNSTHSVPNSTELVQDSVKSNVTHCTDTELKQSVESSQASVKDTELKRLERVKVSVELEDYHAKIKSVIFHKVMTRLSKVYASMTIDFFTRSVCPPEFYPWQVAEKEVVSLVHGGQCRVRFDYSGRVLHFNERDDSAASVRHQLADLGKSLYQALRRLSPQATRSGLSLVAVRGSIEKERLRLMRRTSEIYQRRQEHQEEQQRAEEERRRREHMQRAEEERLERERREEALRALEQQRRRDERFRAKSEIAQQILVELRRLGSSCGRVFVRGRPLEEYGVEDLVEGALEFEDLEKAQEEHFMRERQEVVSRRRGEQRRAEHLLRALREADQRLYPGFQAEVLAADLRVLEEAKKRRESAFRRDAEEMRKEKELFSAVRELKDAWVREREAEFAALEAEQRRRFEKLLKGAKIHRAKLRLQHYLTHVGSNSVQPNSVNSVNQVNEVNLGESVDNANVVDSVNSVDVVDMDDTVASVDMVNNVDKKRLDEIAQIQREKMREIEEKLSTSYASKAPRRKRPESDDFSWRSSNHRVDRVRSYKNEQKDTMDDNWRR